MRPAVPRIIFLALSNMTWASTLARTAAGGLPGLAALLGEGARAQVAPSVEGGVVRIWPSVATGVTGDVHGLLSLQELWPGGLRQSGRQSWRAAPYWERLEAAGIATMSVGWPWIRPGAAWSGVQVDDRLGEPTGKSWDEWLLPPDIASPDLRDLLREIRVHPTDIESAQLRPFVSAIGAVDQYRDQRLVDIALLLARFSTDFAAFTTLLAERPARVASLHIDLLARLQARFEDAPAPFAGTVDAGWTLIDSAVAAIAACLGAADTLILFSPGRRGEAGLLAARGPGLPADTELPPVTLLDIAPSLLARCGFSAPDLPGKARLGALRDMTPAPLSPIETPFVQPDGEDLARVRAFGFEPPRPDPQLHAQRLVEQAELLIVARPALAKRLAEQALALAPDMPIALGLVAATDALAGDFSRFADLADRLDAVSPGHMWVSLIRAGLHASRGGSAAAAPLLHHVEADGGPPEWLRAAAAWLMLRRITDARRLFGKVVERQPDSIAGLIGLGMTHSATSDESQTAYRRVLALDPGNAHALDGLRKASVLRPRAARS